MIRILIFLIAFLAASSARATIYYAVSPAGNDAAPCTLPQPCLTLEHTRSVVAAAIAGGMIDDVKVYLRGGTYTLATELTLGAVDSGRDGHIVTWRGYPGETAIVNGAATIGSWALWAGSIYRADVTPGWTFRQLYVNGVSQQRARGDTNPAGWTEIATGLISPVDMSGWLNPTLIETVHIGGWVMHRGHFSSVIGTTMTGLNPYWTYHYAMTSYPPYVLRKTPSWVENALELLDTEGEWYLDPVANQVYFWPAGGTMVGKTVTAPVATSLLAINGASGLAIERIVFSGSNWLWPDSDRGYLNQQDYVWDIYAGPSPPEPPVGLAVVIPASITVTNSSDIEMRYLDIQNMGSRAVLITGGSRNVLFTRNWIDNNAGGGIQVGDGLTCPAGQTSYITVSDTYFGPNNHHDYWGEPTVFQPCTRESLVAHNELDFSPWAAITSGWGWGIAHNGHHNRVKYNYVKYACQWQDDCGSIYTNSIQSNDDLIATGAEIEGNYLTRYQRNCFMNDDRSSYITGTSNVCEIAAYFVSGNWLRIETNTAHDQVWTDNFSDTTNTAVWPPSIVYSPNTLTPWAPRASEGRVLIIRNSGVSRGVFPGATSHPDLRWGDPPAVGKVSQWDTWGTLPASGLIGWWTMEERRGHQLVNYYGSAGGGQMSYPGANTGLDRGADPSRVYFSTDSSGKYAAYFDGVATFADMLNSAAPLLSATGSWTIAGWIYQVAQNNGYPIFAQRLNQGVAGQLYVDTEGAAPYQVKLFLGAIGGYPATWLTHGTTISANAWHFWAISRSGATFKLYVDSSAPVQYVDVDAGRSLLQTGNLLGGWNGSAVFYNGAVTLGFPGLMRNMVAYSRTLSDKELTRVRTALTK